MDEEDDVTLHAVHPYDLSAATNKMSLGDLHSFKKEEHKSKATSPENVGNLRNTNFHIGMAQQHGDEARKAYRTANIETGGRTEQFRTGAFNVDYLS